MNDTRIVLSAEQQSRLATGHTMDLSPTPSWDIITLEGAGALRSTVNDMLKFAAANLGLVKTKLFPVLQRSHQMQRPTDSPNLDIALGWHIHKRFGTEIIWHNGGTGGYRTFTGFDPKKRAGVVVLSNSGVGQDDIGLHILESQFTLQKFAPAKSRTEIKVDPKVLETYVGEYQIAPNVKITVTREDDKLFGQPTDQPRLQLFAETESEFFLKVVDAQVTFVKDDKGQVTQLLLHQGGQRLSAKKIR
jgi:CubicO group peptidase (beta-lactamase class C family)